MNSRSASTAGAHKLGDCSFIASPNRRLPSFLPHITRSSVPAPTYLGEGDTHLMALRVADKMSQQRCGRADVLDVLRRLASRRERIAGVDGLADFLAARTAFVSQKSALDYCRARAGIGWTQLFREDEFGRAIERCRWESYAAVLADVGEVALIYLRHCGGDGPGLAVGLGRAVRAALVRHPVPAHRPDWDETCDVAQARLHRALLAPPRSVHRVGRSSAGKVFEVLPIHTNLKAHDREMVVNNVRFLLCRVYADMEARARWPGLGAGAHGSRCARL